MINFLLGSLILREHRTGVHRYYFNLLENINKNDVCISVYESEDSVNKRYNNDVPFKKYLKYSFKFARLLAYFLPIEFFFGRSDIYICDGLFPISIYKSKKISIIHDLMVYRYPQNYSYIMRIYLKSFFEISAKRADLIIAVSQQTKDDIIKYLGVPENRIAIVYNGVDESIEGITDKDPMIDLSQRYIFYIGDFRANKNVLNAIKAFERYIKQTQDDIYFYLAGSKKSKDYQMLNKYVEKHGLQKRVIFCGYVSDAFKVKLYKNAFAFIFVSFFEGFGVPIIEAMQYNTPVITSNCSSMKEIAIEDSALLVDPNQVDMISDAIAALNNPQQRKSQIENGKRIAARYTWENAALQFSEAIAKVSK